MRIAFLTDTYFPQINGVNYALKNWREELESRGHEVYVVYPKNDHNPGKREIELPSVKSRLVDGYRVGVPTFSSVEEKLPDLDAVHSHGQFAAAVLGLYFSRKNDLPHIASHHTPGEHYLDYLTKRERVQRGLEKVYTRWEKYIYRKADKVTAPSEYERKRLQSKVNTEVETLSNGVDTDFFEEKETDFLEERGIEAEKVVGYCGRLCKKKNIEDLIIYAERFDGEIVVAGGGFKEDYYRNKFEKKENITFIGRLDRDEMPKFYSSLDLFITPSTVETQGLTVLEANSCSTPVIGANSRALKDTIEEGRSGYRYRQGDIDKLDKRVQKAFKRLKRLEKGAKDVAGEHSVEKTVEKLTCRYRKLG
ncbi:MAG: glycosyltransferase [Candidatus Nanohaloarchaeota archaeon QJJ-9]|nr:glycosyltransferase [Candidatus Nanohaloarchaeota archaeon QJJ-9]